MNLLIIAVEMYKAASDERRWLESLGAVRSKKPAYPDTIWIAQNVAVLDLHQRETIGPKLLADLRSHKLRYRLYGACDYPAPLAEQIENYP
jgi:hypothetical protein